jgi:hypothetical protein
MLAQCWWRQHREHSVRFGRAVLTSRLLAKQLVTGRRDDVDVGTYERVVSQKPQVNLCGDTVVVCAVGIVVSPGTLSAVRSVGMAALTVARWFRRRRFKKWNAASTMIAKAWRAYKRRCRAVSLHRSFIAVVFARMLTGHG